MKKAFLKGYDQLYKKECAHDVKVWKMNSDMTVKRYNDIIRKASSAQMKNEYKLKEANAKLFDQDDFIVEDLVLAEDDCLIA